jgi:hypothetical protein
MSTNTVKFAKFPFEHNGIHFVSKVAETNRYLPQIMMMGEEFITMNKGAIDELMPMLQDLSLEEIQENLDVINFGGTEMFLELGHETLERGI